ncbi:MAG: hypothetical protein [Caudoviricetes sp.]|nr:MAG: hypothetical protein [Caudoviricetes sp.]
MRKYDEVQQLLKNARAKAKLLSETTFRPETVELLEKMATEIEELTALLEKQQQIIRRVYVDHFPNTWFPTGGIGEKDSNGLPEYIEVCPAYGVGWTILYKKTDRTISTEGA